MHGYVEFEADPIETLMAEIQNIRIDVTLQQAGFAVTLPHQTAIELRARVIADIVQPFYVQFFHGVLDGFDHDIFLMIDLFAHGAIGHPLGLLQHFSCR